MQNVHAWRSMHCRQLVHTIQLTRRPSTPSFSLPLSRCCFQSQSGCSSCGSDLRGRAGRQPRDGRAGRYKLQSRQGALKGACRSTHHTPACPRSAPPVPGARRVVWVLHHCGGALPAVAPLWGRLPLLGDQRDAAARLLGQVPRLMAADLLQLAPRTARKEAWRLTAGAWGGSAPVTGPTCLRPLQRYT